MTRTITTRTICTSEHSSAPCVVFPVFITCHTTLAQVVLESVIFTVVAHVSSSLILFDLPFYFHLYFPVLFLFSFLMHPDLHTDLDNLDSVENNPRHSAKGSNDAYDVAFSLTQERKSDELMEVRTGRPVDEQPTGLFTQRTDRFIVDDDDMESDTVAESDMSLKSRSFLHRVNDRVRKIQDQSSKDATEDSNKLSLIW